MSCSSPSISLHRFQWSAGVPAELSVSADEIHVWIQGTSRPPGEVESFRALLSGDELARAERFRFERDRAEYIVSRGTLRTLLASYVASPPRDLHFEYSEYGRPSLPLPSTQRTLEFNVAHSGEVVLLAFAHDRRIGIDVEKVRRDFQTSEVAERFFSAAEREALRRLPEQDRHEAFFRCWTRKEALIKALGEGLSHPLHQFDVNLTPNKPAKLLATRPDPDEVQRWMLWDIRVAGDYAAALAAETGPQRPHR